MDKVSRKQWFTFTLLGLMLFAAFLIGVGLEALQGETQTVAAVETTGRIRATGQVTLSHLRDCSQAHRGPSFGSVVVVTDEEVVCGDLTSFGGSATIRGVVKGDVVMFAGNMVIDGVVNGDVSLYGGNLTLGNNAQVNGDVHVCGGIWRQGSSSQLHGSAFACTKSLGALLAGASSGSMRFWFTLVWVIVGLLLTSLLPENVMLVCTTAKSKMGRKLCAWAFKCLVGSGNPCGIGWTYHCYPVSYSHCHRIDWCVGTGDSCSWLDCRRLHRTFCGSTAA